MEYEMDMGENGPLRLLCVLAHPDDETFGTGGTLIRYALDEQVETYLLTLTKGQQGWFGPPEENPGPEELGKIREQELQCASRVLGINDVSVLDYCDGEVDQADPKEVVEKITAHIRLVKPHVLITFDPAGVYGHPDHIAVSQFTAAAVSSAAYPEFLPGLSPHIVSKLYFVTPTKGAISRHEDLFGELRMEIDGVERYPIGWPEWAVTTVIETEPYWEQILQAILCHRSQLTSYGKLTELDEKTYRHLWQKQRFYRVFSLVNRGREKEDDIFAGLR